MEARGAPEGERKTITALFADMAGFTALARDLDPEDTRAIIDPALQLMMDAVHRYEGYVAQSLSDGIFALFGAPIAHEDHPQRALYAALRMQEEMRQYASRIRLEKGVPLQMRVGINTGEVVLRSVRKDDLRTDYVPVGHSINVASRMKSMAMPGSIVASEHTYKLIEGYFECKALGVVQVKGLDEPANIYEVLGIGPLRTRLQVATRRGLVRFVGRQSELEQLKKTLEQAKAGHGQIVGVMGELGVGRSDFLALLADAYGKVGQTEEGFAVLDEVLAAVNKTGERMYEAELYRLKGTLTLQKFQVSGSKFQVDNPQSAFRNPQLEAEACFLKAIEVAQRQQAKSLELRAVTSLARRWQSQGKKEEARQMLAEIYNWFTEGFDTKDLQEAKVLLEELSH